MPNLFGFQNPRSIRPNRLLRNRDVTRNLLPPGPGMPIVIEGDSNTSWGYDPLNWSKTAIQLSSQRVRIVPGGHLASPGSTIAYSGSSNSIVDRQTIAESLIDTGEPMIFMWMIGTNSEAGQTAEFAATSEMETYLGSLKAINPQLITICVLPLYNTDLGNQVRIDAQDAWARSSANVDHVLDAKSLNIGTMGRPNTHMDDNQHFLVGSMVGDFLRAIAPSASVYKAHPDPLFNEELGAFSEVDFSAIGGSGVFAQNWTLKRPVGTGTAVGEEANIGGYPAQRLTITGGAEQTIFKMSTVVNQTQLAGTVLDAAMVVTIESYTGDLVPYVGLEAGNGVWPNAMLPGVGLNPSQWAGSHVWRVYPAPLDADTSSHEINISAIVEPNETLVLSFGRPILAVASEPSATPEESVIAPAALTAPVMDAVTSDMPLGHTPGTYSGTPAPVVSYSYYVDGEAVDVSYTLTAGQSVYVSEVASNSGGSAQQVSATVVVQEPEVTDPGLTAWNSAMNDKKGNNPYLEYTESDRTVTALISLQAQVKGVDILTGKAYFEIEAVTDILSVGVSTADHVEITSSGTWGVVRAGWYTGLIFYSGGNQSSPGALVAGDIAQIAVDRDAGLMWLRRNGTGDWNNSAGADPATGVGGVDISGLVGDISPYAVLNSGVGQSAILHGTSDRITYSAPTGFSTMV